MTRPDWSNYFPTGPELKAGRCSMAEEPDTVSEMTRRGLAVNPAASISWICFSVVCPTAETRTYAKVLPPTIRAAPGGRGTCGPVLPPEAA
jgi:hypothetical protein